jgi:16S rRNA G966 N2-methylase RsmD
MRTCQPVENNYSRGMAKKAAAKSAVAADVSPRQTSPDKSAAFSRTPPRPSALVDTRVIYCGDNLEQLAKLPDACVDLIYIDPPFNSNRNYEVFWGSPREIISRATHPRCLRRISRG